MKSIHSAFHPLRTRLAGAFSQVEMLVVIAIVAILAAVAIPHVGQHSKSEDVSLAAQKAKDVAPRIVENYVILLNGNQVPAGITAEDMPSLVAFVAEKSNIDLGGVSPKVVAQLLKLDHPNTLTVIQQ